MHGKFGFRQLLKEGKIQTSDVIREMRAQINKFIKLYGSLPSHVDSHQHINAIPELAELFCKVVVEEYGIYKIRMQLENLDVLDNGGIEEQAQQFYREIVQ